MAAEEVPATMAGREVLFKGGSTGRIVAVPCAGDATLGALRMKATPEDPLLRIALAGHRMVLRRIRDFAELAA